MRRWVAPKRLGPYTEPMAEPPDIEDLSRRFLDLWRQHLTAVTTEPATGQDAWLAMTRLWTQGSDNADGVNPAANTGVGVTPPGTATGTAPVTGASERGGDAVRDLERRVRELEERIADLESGNEPRG